MGGLGRRVIEAAFEFPIRRPGRALLLAAAVMGAALLPFARLAPVHDVSAVVQTPSSKTWDTARRVFGLDDQAILLLSADRPGREADLLALAARLERSLGESGVARSVEYGLPVSPDVFLDRFLLPYGPLYDTPEGLRARLAPEGMAAILARQAERLALPGLGEADRWAQRDPLEFHRPVLSRFASLMSLGAGQGFRQGSAHYFSRDGRALLVTVAGVEPASHTAAARRMVERVRESAREELQDPRFEGLSVWATGGYHLAEESERIVKRDLVVSLTSSGVLAILLLAFAFRLRPLAVLALSLPTLWGTAVGLGLFVAIDPAPSALSFGCAALLVGLGIDFTIHIANEALSRRATGEAAPEAVSGAVRATRVGLAVAAATSIAAFLAFQASGQVFLRQMGLLSVSGLAACYVGAFFVLPPILARISASRPAGGKLLVPRGMGARALAAGAASHPRVVLAAAALLSAGAAVAVALRPPTFETDLRNLHARDSGPLAVQERISRVFGGSREPLLVLVEADDEAAAASACHRLEEPLARMTGAGRLASRVSIAALLPSAADQERCLAVLRERSPLERRTDAARALEEAGFDPAAYGAYLDGIEAAARLRAPLTLGALRERGFAPLADRLVREDRLAGRPGRAYALVVLYPRADLWDPAEREAVVGDVEVALREAGVEGSLTGLYLVSADSALQVAADFREVSLLTLAAIVLVLFLRFRRPGRVLLVLAPAALAALWTAGLGALLGQRLNLMNISVLPMVLAIGVDDGVHIVERYLRDPGRDILAILNRTGTAVVLTSLTTMVSFGSFALSANRGLASVGFLTLAGLGSALVASVTVLPAALVLLGKRTLP